MITAGPLETGIPRPTNAAEKNDYLLHTYTEPGMSRTYQLGKKQSIAKFAANLHHHAAKLAPWKFSCRTINKTTRLVRVWRIR